MAGSSTLREFAMDFVKLERFDGSNFKCWQKKMHFLLVGLKVMYVLTTPKPAMNENETLVEGCARLKWEQDDYICKDHICNSMSDNMFDLYQNMATTKELWDALEAKYLTNDAISMKFFIENFFNYIMVDNMFVVEQFHETMHILNQFNQHNMKMDECISVSSIIDKLNPSWKDVRKFLKHGKDDMSLEQLGQHFQIEEVLRQNQKGAEEHTSKVHMMEERGNSK
ncbi:uncharacterized protein LOC131155963 [Malania oleifera]|uniref:uncharacterized protein LOC131155963 n=1 Tax=Malania oleifera TaxID=397392 RepID=UPI0025ADBAFC|nr:uncharacterized protein LOC131155963 [Malania oleifera]